MVWLASGPTARTGQSQGSASDPFGFTAHTPLLSLHCPVKNVRDTKSVLLTESLRHGREGLAVMGSESPRLTRARQ